MLAFTKANSPVIFASGCVIAAGISALMLRAGHLPPGFAVAALAVTAAVATLIKDLEQAPCARAILFIAWAAFFFEEAQAIKIDRAAQDNAHQVDQYLMAGEFQRVLDKDETDAERVLVSASVDLANTERRFDDVLSEDRNLEQLSKENLLSLTGGNSFPYVVPQPPDADGSIRLVAWNKGSYPLTGLTVTIHRVTEMPWTDAELSVGTIPAHGLRELSYRVHPSPGDRGTDSYWIFFDAQNGQSTEMLQFRPSKSGTGWASTFIVDQSQLPCDRSSKGARHPGFQPALMYRPWSDDHPAPGAPHVLIGSFRPGCVSFDRR